ncbi:MAG: hypothetical protein ACQERH_10670 [Acidobacteriota bacterium]
MKNKSEKFLFAFLVGVIIFSIFFFSSPQFLKADMVCGVWYEPLPITAHDFEYESNCCVVIEP